MKLASIITVVALSAGCAVTAAEEAGQSDSELRALTAQEVLGVIAYGETKDVDFTPAPRYRAFAFEGTRGDTVEAKVTAQDGTDPILWLTDAEFNTIALSDNPKPTDTNPLITRTLQKSGKFYLVFREMRFAPRAKFSVSLIKKDVVPVECDPDGEGIWDDDCVKPLGFDPFDPASCSGPALTADEATAKLGVTGGLNFEEGKAKIYYRTRQCSTVTGCSPWVRAHLMDIEMTSISAAVAPATGFSAVAKSRAKVKVDFTADGLAQFCVDGPFATVQGSEWTLFTDGTPGVCGSTVASPAAVTATCARFEVPTIKLRSIDPTQTTEYGAVLMARY